MNSLCGTVAVSEPPTNAPSAMRHVLFVSPSQPLNVLPSRRGTDVETSAPFNTGAPSEIRPAMSRVFIDWRCFAEVPLQAAPTFVESRPGRYQGSSKAKAQSPRKAPSAKLQKSLQDFAPCTD